jgi:putative ABC transport system ATP-binding protein
MNGNKKNAHGIIQKAKSLMGRTGISGLEKRDITEVSGGQLQRACICRALINSPEILFADEPTGSLNSKTTDEIMDLLTDINKDGTAVLLVTHDSKVAARADRVFFTKDGAIVTDLPLNKWIGSGLEARTEKVVALMSAVGI